MKNTNLLLISDDLIYKEWFTKELNKSYKILLLSQKDKNLTNNIIKLNPAIVLIDTSSFKSSKNIYKIGVELSKNKSNILLIYILSDYDEKIINSVDKSNLFCFIKKSIPPDDLKIQLKTAFINYNFRITKNRETKILDVLNKISFEIRKPSDLNTLFKRAVNSITMYGNTPFVDIFIYNEKSGFLEFKASSGIPKEIYKKIKLPINNSLSGKCFKNKKIIISRDLKKDKRIYGNISKYFSIENFSTGIFIPIISKTNVLGVIHFLYKDKIEIYQTEMSFFRMLGESLGMAIENRLTIEHNKILANKHKTLFNESNDSIIIHTIEGDVVDINKMAIKTFGYSKERFLEMNIKELPHSDCDMCKKATKELLRKKRVRFEGIFKKASGEPIYVEVSSKIIKIGNEIFIQGIVRDISKRKKDEQQLKNRYNSLKLIYSITDRLKSKFDTDKIIKTIISIFSDYKGKPIISIAKLKDNDIYFDLLYTNETKRVYKKLVKISNMENSLSGLAIKTKKVLYSGDIFNDKRIEENHRKQLFKDGYRYIISIPLYSGKKPFGILNIGYKENKEVSKEELKTLEIIGKTIGTILSSAVNLQKLKESEENYRLLANTAKDLILKHKLNGEIVYINKSFMKLLKCKEDKLIGEKIQNILRTKNKKYMKELINRKKEREKGNRKTFRYITTFSTKTDEEITVEAISTPLIKNGKIDSILVIARDIRERLRYEEYLRIFNSVIEQATISIVITDPEGNIEYVNKSFEFITGYNRKEVIGQNPRILKSGKQNNEFYKNMWNNIKKGKIWHSKIINKKKNGTLYTEDITIFPVFNEYGNIIRFASTRIDITKELQLEERIRQMQKLEAIGNLTAGIAHDFNNILTSILGYSDILERALKKDEKLSGQIKIIKKSGEKAKNLVAQLLAFSRKQIIKPENVEINEIINHLKKMLERVISEDIKLIYNLKPISYKIQADKNQIEQILINLVVNSSDAIKESKNKEKQIIIETDIINIKNNNQTILDNVEIKDGKYVLIKISDTGIGIKNELINKVIEPFFTTKEIGKGTGLGLSTVYGIVKQNNGYMHIYSEYGKGTSIKIYWPVYKQSKNKPVLKNQKKDINTSKNLKLTGKALIVEDDENVREITKEFISRIGLDVLEAKNGFEGVNLTKIHKDIRLIITDIVMPEMDGYEFYNNIKEDILKTTKIIFTSGYPLSHPEIKKLVDGDIKFLQKPFTIDDLIPILEKLFKH